MTSRAVFLDRDGTINKEVNYLSKKEQVEILPGSAKAISLLNEQGFKTIIITNQSGVARGYFSEQTLEDINKHLKGELLKEGANIDAIYYCPHHPDDGCDCRKPKIGLIKRAEKEQEIDLNKSYMIGDSIKDIQAGVNAGLKCILVLTGYGEKEKLKLEDAGMGVGFIAKDVLSAVLWILEECEA